MMKSIVISSMIILSQTSLTNASGADFEYPENVATDSWAAPSVLPAGEPNYCGNNHVFQSPIDIQTSTAQSCLSSNALTWELNNAIHNFTVENTGHNLKMIPVCCGIEDEEHSNDGDSNDNDDSNDNPEFENLESGRHFGVLKDLFGDMEEYCLDSFHIHWGADDNTGSEHRINGVQSPMEMHFVHRACKYNTVTDAISINIPEGGDETADPTLAVVSILFEVGSTPNLLIQKIVEQVTKLEVAEAEIDIVASDLDFFDVVPMSNGEIQGNYYHYKGSLTTPPCTPVVSWHVLEKTMTVTAEQLQALRSNIDNNHGAPSAPNFRGVKTNGHTVYKCSAAGNGSDDDSS